MKQILIAIDQLINTLHGGWADETISSRSFRLRHRMPYSFYRKLIDKLFFWQTDHCYQAYMSERLRMQMPPELRV